MLITRGYCITDYEQLNNQLQHQSDITYDKFNTNPLSVEAFWEEFYEEEENLESWAYDAGNLERPDLDTNLDKNLETNLDINLDTTYSRGNHAHPSESNTGHNLLHGLDMNTFSEYQRNILQFRDSASHTPPEPLYITVRKNI